ncbi:MAG: bifunctional methionine sulfoxide reductase B/A protein [Candidatus Aminicenantes bacterium]|nr:bifunctional methionine sulfoxide reductase B/A protein [Candidatus Aminicenantes bacterium]
MRNLPLLIIIVVFLVTGYIVLNATSKLSLLNLENEQKGEKSMVQKVNKTDKEWKKILTPEQYRVLRKSGTERAFTGKYNDHYEEGVYQCAGCGTSLFSSETKYDHGTGWPSFTAPVKEEYLEYSDDYKLGMKRIEVRCAVCGGHLGHVFDDGPAPTFKHYCINSVSLDFKPFENDEKEVITSQNKKIQAENKKPDVKTAVFAAGCFWGVEHKLRQVEGVLATEVGYTGGKTKNPTYRQVCTKNTGHAEAIRLNYDASQISYEELLDVFFNLHDPTQLNRQGPDVGDQYRSAIFYHNEEQKQAAEKKIAELEKSGRTKKPVVTQVVAASAFYRAEEYHQQYIEKTYGKKINRTCGTSCAIK